MENFKNKLKPYEDKAISLLSSLIGIDTVLDEYKPNSSMPFGEGNKKALELLLSYAKEDGFNVKNVDNYAGHVEFGSGEVKLGILAHLDVVPVKKEEWVSDPFTLSIRDDKFYGRGSLDDKGPLVASYIAMKMLLDEGFKPNGLVRLIAGCDEESGSRCIEHYFEVEKKPEMGFSPDAEFPLIYGEKAMLSYDVIIYGDNVIKSFSCGERYNIVPSKASCTLNVDIKKEFLAYLEKNNYKGNIEGDEYTTFGIASHAMAPQKGLSALSILMDFLALNTDSKLAKFYTEYLSFDAFGNKMGYNIYDEEMKELTANPAICNGSDVIKIGVNCRVPLDSQLRVIEEKVKDATAKYGYSYEIVSTSNRHFVSKDTFLVKTLMDVFQKTTGNYEAKPFTIGGGTYARELTNAVAFGALAVGKEDVCHIANEYFALEDFYKAIEIYYYSIKELMK